MLNLCRHLHVLYSFFVLFVSLFIEGHILIMFLKT